MYGLMSTLLSGEDGVVSGLPITIGEFWLSKNTPSPVLSSSIKSFNVMALFHNLGPLEKNYIILLQFQEHVRPSYKRLHLPTLAN